MSSPRSEQAVLDYLDRLLTEEQSAPPPTATLPRVAPTLQRLLSQVEVQAQQATAVETVTAAPPVVVAPVVAPVAAPVVAPVVAPAVAPAPVPVAVPVVTPTTTPVSVPVAKTVATTETASGVQAGGGQPKAPEELFREQLPAHFQTLIFRIGELRLAVPLHLLGGIHRRGEHLTEFPGKPEWFMGLMVRNDKNIQVVDTARFVAGERYEPGMSSDLQIVIVLGNSQWGLACSEICTTRDVSEDAVRWSPAHSKRPWLAGMLKDELCALLNIDALIQSLESKPQP